MKKWRSAVLLLAIMAAVTGCGKDENNNTTGASVNTTTETVTSSEKEDTDSEASDNTETESTGEENSGEEKTEAATVEKEEVVTPGMVAVKGSELNDGEYDITVKSSSSMFNIESCRLTVKDGRMTAKMIMSGKGYLYIYPGSKEEAERNPQTEYISFEEEADGSHSFTFPVTILNDAVPCAAFSKKKELWYDRDLCFEATALPMSAYKKLPYDTVESLGLFDGEFAVDVTLTGGSGRASVASPAVLKIEDGKAYATIEWSSDKYDYMIVNGDRYDPVNAEGENSAFIIPVAGFNYPLPVQADTTAMSTAHLIDYTLYFDSNSIRK